jgi:hypothetical protein
VISSPLVPGLGPLEARLAAASLTLGAGAVALPLALRSHSTSITRRVDPPADFLAALEREIARSRRYERPLAVLRMATEPAEADSPFGPALRDEDRAWRQDHVLFVLLPETDRLGAEICATRLQRQLGDGVLEATAVCFPTDALTARGLLAALDHSDRDERGAA